MTTLHKELISFSWQKTGTLNLRGCNIQPPLLPLKRVASGNRQSRRLPHAEALQTMSLTRLLQQLCLLLLQSWVLFCDVLVLACSYKDYELMSHQRLCPFTSGQMRTILYQQQEQHTCQNRKRLTNFSRCFERSQFWSARRPSACELKILSGRCSN